MHRRPTANLYVDGFNLYRRSLEGHPETKWLDLVGLGQQLMPDHDIQHVHYFTALLRQGLLADDRAASRQAIYLRALRTDRKVTIHLGRFRNDPRWMPAHPQILILESREFMKHHVRKLEEKGSDVNLAGRMIADACLGKADMFVLLSNDSDQTGTMKLLKEEIGVQTGIIFPMPSAKAAKDLVKTNPTFKAHVSAEALVASQFPRVMHDSIGDFHRPPSWS